MSDDVDANVDKPRRRAVARVHPRVGLFAWKP
jgi:hypothetical protein